MVDDICIHAGLRAISSIAEHYHPALFFSVSFWMTSILYEG